jgi:hypothetical protein
MDAGRPAVPSLIRDALGRSGLGGYEVAHRLSRLLGVPVTKEHLHAWSTGPGEAGEGGEGGRPFPLLYAAAFCRATGDPSLIRYLVEQQKHRSIARQEQQSDRNGRKRTKE